jgi:hypothetical protein
VCDRRQSASPGLAGSTVPPVSVPPVFMHTPPSIPRILWRPPVRREVPSWCPGPRRIPGLLRVPLILTSQQIRHIYQCQLYSSSSEGVGVGGTTTISGIPRDLAVVAAVAAGPIVDCVPTQVCPLKSHGSSGSQGNQDCAPVERVQSGPNTGSLIYSLPPSGAASVQ